jgi:two-component sensor histidine kinase
MAVVLTELLQNAVDHAFPEGGPGGHARVELANDEVVLRVRVVDNGAGLPEGFQLEKATGLGLSIVRALVVSDLGGTLSAEPGPEGGTIVSLSVPLVRR